MREVILILLMMAILLVTKAPILQISVEPMTEKEKQALEALKIPEAPVRELEWWEVRDLVAEMAAAAYQLKMEGHEVKVPLLFPVKGPLEVFSHFFKEYINYLEVSLNGRKLLLTLDTGAPFTALTPRSAQQIPISMEFKPREEIKHYSIPIFLGKGDIAVGQAQVKSVPIIVVQSNVTATLLSIPIWHHTGTLGFDFLSQFSSATIDYPNRVLVLRHPDLEYEPKQGALRLPLRVFKFRPLVDVYIDGKGPFPFLFDTGPAAKKLLVAPEIAVELGFVGKVSSLRLGRAELGELSLKDTEAEVILLPKEQEFLGIIPRGLFRSYRVTIDLKKQLIFLEQ